MRVRRASTAGFCMGVDLALKKLESALRKRSGMKICTLGPIIHNPQVLADFAARGVACLESVEDATLDSHVLIRAHGVPRQEEARLLARCASVSDATCPKVKKAQLSIAAATKGGETLLLFGEACHPEVVGLISYANGPAEVFSSEAGLMELRLEAGRSYVLASQTTQDREAFERIGAYLSSRLQNLVILSTICDATRQRQAEALAIARSVDAMVVIGGRQSGNTRRLAELARDAGIETFHVETVRELRPDAFMGKKLVGLTAGASTPATLIAEAEAWLLALDA